MSSRSRKPGPTRTSPFGVVPPHMTPGATGKTDYANPQYWMPAPVRCVYGDTPGPVGVNDHGSPEAQLNMRNPVSAEIGTDYVVGSTKVARGPLQVDHGQVTFDCEGNDDPTSPYYSRLIHWPGTVDTGVRIGRGYDMGDRSQAEVIGDLVAAGLTADRAAAFGKGSSLKGTDADRFVKENREKLGEISIQVQKALFERMYSKLLILARKDYEYWTRGNDGLPCAGRVDWEKLDPVIRDVLVDFVFQGYITGPHPMLEAMKDDFDELMRYIQSAPALKQYHPGSRRRGLPEVGASPKAEPAEARFDVNGSAYSRPKQMMQMSSRWGALPMNCRTSAASRSPISGGPPRPLMTQERIRS